MARTVEDVLQDIPGERGEKIRKFHQEHLKFFDQAAGSGRNHQAWEGGYRHHLEQFFTVARGVYVMMSDYLPKLGREAPWESVVVVGYFHDIEKMYKYSQLNCAGGFNSALFDKMNYLKFVLNARWGIELTEAELNAIHYVHGEGADYRPNERVMTRLCAICHMADVASARILYDVGHSPEPHLSPVEAAYRIAKDELDALPDLPCRIDEMTDREAKIANIACELTGTLKCVASCLGPIVDKEGSDVYQSPGKGNSQEKGPTGG